MKILVCLLLAAITRVALGQSSPFKFGEIPMDDMKMILYEPDSSASAVILADFGKSEGNTFERHVRIKILNKDGLRPWADVIIPLFGSGVGKQKVLELKASTYNLAAGRIVEDKMTEIGVFKESYSDDIHLHKFTMPNVREGSVIEYFYRVRGTGIPNWEFQKTVPVRWSEYWAIVPHYFKLEIYMQGYVPVAKYEVQDKSMVGYQAKAYHWISKNVPAFRNEPFMTSERNYISKVNFAISYIDFPGLAPIEIMSSWSKLNEDLLNDDRFGKLVSKSNSMKDEVEKIVTGIQDPMKKIEAIHGYVRQTMEWNGSEKITAQNLKQALEKKVGSSGEINLLLAGMLEKAGFLVDMVILSTRDHGIVRPAYPMVQQFNYAVCVARVDGKPILLDATEKFLPYTILPLRCLNGQGFMISKLTPDWINITPKAKARTVIDVNLHMENNGAVKGSLQLTFDGYDALKARKEYEVKGEEAYIKSVLQIQDWQIQKSEFQNVTDLSKSMREIHDVTKDSYATVSGDVIYVSPFANSLVEVNPFRSESRQFPVDFGSPVEKMIMIRINVPEGFAVDELPESKIFKMPDNSAKYTFNATQAGNLVSVLSNLQINKAMYLQDEYPVLREFYNQVIGKQAEQIVLKKKETRK